MPRKGAWRKANLQKARAQHSENAAARHEDREPRDLFAASTSGDVRVSARAFASLSNQHTTLQARFATLQSDNEAVQKALESQTRAKNRARSQLEEKENLHSSVVMRLESEVATARTELQELRKQFHQSEGRVVELQIDHSRLAKRHGRLVASYDQRLERQVSKQVGNALTFNTKESGHYKGSVRDLGTDLVSLYGVPAGNVGPVMAACLGAAGVTTPQGVPSYSSARRFVVEGAVASELQIAAAMNDSGG